MKKLCQPNLFKICSQAQYHGRKPSNKYSYTDSDSVPQDLFPSFVKGFLEKEKSELFSEFKDESLFSSMVRSFERKRDGPPKRLSWTADTFSIENLARVFNMKKKEFEMQKQRFVAERHKQLGNDIAAAHFIVYRGGAVRLFGKNEWIRADMKNLVDYAEKLPKKFHPSIYLEAIDLSGLNIYYEGLKNIQKLTKLKQASFANCVNFDDWCLDKITNEYSKSLQYLDISGCAKITYHGLTALTKLDNLSTLIVNGISDSNEFQLTCLMLEEVFPKLVIEGIKYIDLDANKERNYTNLISDNQTNKNNDNLKVTV